MIDFFIKSTISLAVLLAVYRLFLEREKMHRFNRFYLLGALTFSLALPFITIPIYVKAEALEESVINVNPVNTTDISSKAFMQEVIIQENNTFDTKTVIQPKIDYWPEVLLYAYCLITLFLAIRFIKNIIRFIVLVNKNEIILYKTAKLILLPHKILPHTFLNFIFINRDEHRAKTIEKDLYTHELAHVNQSHSLDILFIEILKTIFWFNPFLYFYKIAIQLNHEFLADEAVVSESNITTYQNILLQMAAGSHCVALASNINFSITKKRFIMMTKTTPKRKSTLLKFVTAFITAGLIYFLSTETIVYAKGAETPFLSFQQTSTEKDTLAGDARRNEYFSGVAIIIQDSLRKVFVNAPYEKLTSEQKRFYFPTVPEKKKEANGVSEDDYKFSLEQEDSYFYINNKKISRKEFLEHKKEEFATNGFRGLGGTLVNGKVQMTFQFYYYTYPFYNKHVKHLNDHYPERMCKIVISEKPVNRKAFEIIKTGDEIGKNDIEVMDIRRQKEINTPTYNFAEESAKATHKRNAQFPGGRHKFDQYISENLDLEGTVKEKKIFITYTVNTDGSISDVNVLGEKDEEIIAKIKQVFENSDRWIPQQEGGKPVKTNSAYHYPEKNN